MVVLPSAMVAMGAVVGLQVLDRDGYGSLQMLRQSGDIDIYLEGGLDKVLAYARTYGEVTEQHVHLDYFPETEVEAHFIPSMLRHPIANRRLQRWFEEQKPIQFEHWNEVRLCVPTTSFNLVYLLIHIYRHLFGEGVALWTTKKYWSKYLKNTFMVWMGQNTIWIYLWHIPFLKPAIMLLSDSHWTIRYIFVFCMAVLTFGIQYKIVKFVKFKFPNKELCFLKYLIG